MRAVPLVPRPQPRRGSVPVGADGSFSRVGLGPRRRRGTGARASASPRRRVAEAWSPKHRQGDAVHARCVCVFQNYVKAMRLFVGQPVWTAYNRPADHLEARGQYVRFLAQTA